MPDTADARLMNLEHALYDVSARLARAEDSNGAMNSRIQSLNEGMGRCYQVCLVSLAKVSD